MTGILTPVQRAAFGRCLSRCGEQLPLIEFLEGLGNDMTAEREIYEHQKAQAETAIRLDDLSKGKDV